MKINANLNVFEAEVLFDLLHHEITEHEIMSKINFLSKNITQAEFEWHQRHAKSLKKLKAKLLKGSGLKP